MSKTKPVRPQYVALGRRIQALMQSRRLDQSDIARRLGIEPQSVQQWIRGQTAPRGYRIEALAALLEVEPWQMLGAADDSQLPASAAAEEPVRAGAAALRRVPRLSWVSAGSFREMETPAHPVEWDVPSEPMSAAAFSLRVEGDSMEPEFPHGCVIFVEPRAEALNGDFVVVTLDDTHHATFKELVVDGPSRYLKPLNPRYPILALTAHARVCGVVREMRKAYRRLQAMA
ncbi:MAG: LexA family protein [Steroidobacteraceae bacterium]